MLYFIVSALFESVQASKHKKYVFLFQNFVCKICKFLADTRDTVVDHIMQTHSNVEDFEKYSDFENDDENENLSDENIEEYNVKEKYRSPRFLQTNPDGTSKSIYFVCVKAHIHFLSYDLF